MSNARVSQYIRHHILCSLRYQHKTHRRLEGESSLTQKNNPKTTLTEHVKYWKIWKIKQNWSTTQKSFFSEDTLCHWTTETSSSSKQCVLYLARLFSSLFICECHIRAAKQQRIHTNTHEHAPLNRLKEVKRRWVRWRNGRANGALGGGKSTDRRPTPEWTRPRRKCLGIWEAEESALLRARTTYDVLFCTTGPVLSPTLLGLKFTNTKTVQDTHSWIMGTRYYLFTP